MTEPSGPAAQPDLHRDVQPTLEPALEPAAEPDAAQEAHPSGGIVAVAMATMNVATYAFSMLAARMLGPQPYGALVALMATLLVFGVLQLGLQATAARRIAAQPEHRHAVRAGVLRLSVQASLALGAVMLLLTPLIDKALRLDSLFTAAMVGVALVPMTIMGGQAGVLQGERRWKALSWVYVAAGVPRLLLGSALLAWQPTTVVAMAALCLSMFVPMVVGAIALGRPHDPAHDGPLPGSDEHSPRSILSETAHASALLLAFFAVGNIDILVARNQLDAHNAGLYAGGLILTKAVLFLPQFVVVVAFPAMSTSERRRRALSLGLGLVAAAGLVCVVGALALPSLAMVFVGGTEYAAVENSLWQFAIVGTLLSMLQLLVYSVLARQARRSSLLVWAALVGIIVIGSRASTWQDLLHVVMVLDAALCVVLLALSYWRLRER